MAAEDALKFNFEPFPELVTERLLLRRIQLNDVRDLFAMRSDPNLMGFIARPLAGNEQDVIDLIGRVETGIKSNETINWGITLKGTAPVIGTIGYVRSTPEHHRAEVGYMLAKAYHRQGIMTEALMAVLRYGFEVMNLHLVEGVIDPRNGASAGVLEKLGFVKEAHFHENYFFRGQYLDSIHYSLLKSGFIVR